MKCMFYIIKNFTEEASTDSVRYCRCWYGEVCGLKSTKASRTPSYNGIPIITAYLVLPIECEDDDLPIGENLRKMPENTNELVQRQLGVRRRWKMPIREIFTRYIPDLVWCQSLRHLGQNNAKRRIPAPKGSLS